MLWEKEGQREKAEGQTCTLQKKKKKILPPKPKPPRVSVRLRENSKAGKFFPLFHLTSWEAAASDGSLHVACDEAGKSPDFSGPDRALSTVM